MALLIAHGETPFLAMVAITSADRETVHSSPKLTSAVTIRLRPGVIW